MDLYGGPGSATLMDSFGNLIFFQQPPAIEKAYYRDLDAP
jgi:hypothetical protein